MELTHTETIIYLLSLGGAIGFMIGVLVMDRLWKKSGMEES